DLKAGRTTVNSSIEVSGDLAMTLAKGDITQSDAFRVGGDARFDAGSGNIILSHAGNDFVGTVDLRGDAVEITDAGTLALGTIGVNRLYARAATIDLASDVSTSGDQEYHGALELGADVALDSGGNVTFGRTVDGAHRLSVRAGDAVVFGDAVGSNTTLSGLEVEAGAMLAISTVDVAGDLSVAVASDLAQSGAFRVGGDARFDAGSGNIILSHAGNDFVGTVDLRGGAVEIADANTLALGTIEANHLYVRAATIVLANDVSTSGDQEYHGALELGADVALDSGGEVTFGGTVDGAHRLSVQAAGAVGFGGAVGAATALTALDVDAGSFNASRIEVSGDLSVVASSGDISQSGAFRVGGDARFDAGSGNIVLANAGNDFIGTV